MTKQEEFCSIAEKTAEDHGIYLWGGNGESTEALKIGQIIDKETSKENAARVFRFIASLLSKGYDIKNSKACDCSGLVVYILRLMKLIPASADYRAKDLQKISSFVALPKLKPADLVFNKGTEASHVGIYIGNNYVIEAKGRDYGICKTKLTLGNWIAGGRLPFLK